MDTQFWLNKWQNNEIGFHLPKPHPWLVACWPQLHHGTDACHVFVPLCGKSVDLDFFYQQGHQVTANELSEDAVKAVFERLELTPNKTQWEGGVCYQAAQLTIYVGDFFKLNDTHIHGVDWIYDRAALIALPEAMRVSYAQKLVALCPDAQQCLITLDYEQTRMSGPPFALTRALVDQYYQATYAIDELKSANIIEYEPRFAQNGLTELFQRVYRLTPKLHA
ncbi:MAG: thiopurine S-methyltransferase [Bermanella sp.]